jgi:hypothetical protein
MLSHPKAVPTKECGEDFFFHVDVCRCASCGS